MSAIAASVPFNPSSPCSDPFLLNLFNQAMQQSRHHEERMRRLYQEHEQFFLDHLSELKAAMPQANDVITPTVSSASVENPVCHAHVAESIDDGSRDDVCSRVSVGQPLINRPFMRVIPQTEKDVNVPVVETTRVQCPEIVSVSPKKSNLCQNTSSPVSTKSRSAVRPMPRQRVQKRRRVKKCQRFKKGQRSKKRQRDGLTQSRDHRSKSPLHRNSGERVKNLIGQRWAYACAVMPFADPFQRYLVTMDRNGKMC